MVYISRLKLRNFKSFKAADVQLPPTFICFAGPNGAGKSNLADSIRFCMGEKSLRSLRAKKVKDLIHAGAKSAEVILHFKSHNGGASYEIKRAIREDGKIRYRLNGKRTTRGTILETLKRHSLDESGRNTIAQGEVQRLINMNGRERRAIIDSVAGISDFEAKKKEAMGELQTVESRIREARVILGERKAFLDELGREKEVAIRYTGAKKRLTDAKGTLLRKEVDRLEKELDDTSAKEGTLAAEREARNGEMAGVEDGLAKLDAKRAETSAEMQSRQKTNALIRRLEELKASIGSKRQLIEDRKDSLVSLDSEHSKLKEEIAEEQAAIDAVEKGLAALKVGLHDAESALAAAGGLAEDEGSSSLRKSLDAKEDELASAREKLLLLESEISAKKDLIEAKSEEERGILPKEFEQEGSEDVEALRREVGRLGGELDRSFSRIKEINAKMAELDRELLELKEKASIHKMRTSPQLANPALSFIANIKGRHPGIYGTVAELITFDARHAHAVEAAGGGRLMYVVVDSVDTATEVIDKLKKAKAGRATFIPLDTIRTPHPAKAGRFGSVLDVIEAKAEARRAAEFVFADTLLIDTPADAKKLGIGSARMVTESGEIFERSGAVSGGRAQSSMLSANALQRIEQELADVKSTKDGYMAELNSIREEENGIRGERSRLEVRIKTLELQERMLEERRKESEHVFKRKEQLARDIKALEQSVEDRTGERGVLAEKLAAIEKAIDEMRGKLASAESEFRKSTEESSRQRAELSANVSSIKAGMEGKLNEISLRRKELAGKQERLAKAVKEQKEAKAKIAETLTQMKSEEGELGQLESKISSASKAIEKLFEKMKEHEQMLQELGRTRGEIRLALDRISRDQNQLSVKRATAATRLEDLNAELGAYSDAEMIEGGREELSRTVAESERILAELGNVNMAAIDMFDKKKAEIDEVDDRIGKLDVEREAILSMIEEIDEHKKEAFMETFRGVSENFSKLFKHINVGQGHLHLTDPANPFESGLYIKLRRNNQEHSLDALSGGEKTLVALMFIFALQLFKPAPFYILDEVDSALDKPNSKNLADLIASLGGGSQFIVVTHNDTVMSNSDSVIGVVRSNEVSKLVGIKLKQAMTQT